MNDNEHDLYENINIEPDLINLMNLHTIIHNRNRNNAISLVDGVNPRIANDTSEIQEALNDVVVEHVTMMKDSPESVDVVRVVDDLKILTNARPIYVLKDDNEPICYSRSRYALLICGSNIMSEDNQYGTHMDITRF